jgi:hypothetical protein
MRWGSPLDVLSRSNSHKARANRTPKKPAPPVIRIFKIATSYVFQKRVHPMALTQNSHQLKYPTAIKKCFIKAAA